MYVPKMKERGGIQLYDIIQFTRVRYSYLFRQGIFDDGCSVARAMAWGVAWGAAWGVAWGVGCGIECGMGCGLRACSTGSRGVAWGAARGVGDGVLIFVTSGRNSRCGRISSAS